MRKDFIAEHRDAAKTFVNGVARAQEWLHHTPKEQIVTRMESIIDKRQRNETKVLIPYYTGNWSERCRRRTKKSRLRAMGQCLGARAKIKTESIECEHAV